MKKLLAFLAILLVVGCGSSSNDFVSGGTVTPAESTGSIQVEQTLLRAVTTFVTDIRYTGIRPDQSIGYGPVVREKAATTVLEGVPTSVTSLRLEYLNGESVIGRFEIAVVVTANQTTVLSDPAWLNVLGPAPTPGPARGPAPSPRARLAARSRAGGEGGRAHVLSDVAAL